MASSKISSNNTGSNGKLDLHWMAQRMANVEYQPERFSPLRVRIKHPLRASFLLYSSGSVICTGTRSEEAALQACQRFHHLVQRLYPECEMGPVRVTNMVGNAKLGFPLDLEQLSTDNPGRIMYNPELFNGMFYSPREVTGARVILFRNGKVIVTGCKNETDLFNVFAEVVGVVL